MFLYPARVIKYCIRGLGHARHDRKKCCHDHEIVEADRTPASRYKFMILAISCLTSLYILHISDVVVLQSARIRRLSRAYKPSDFHHLRFLTFGTSRAYGVGVSHPRKAFPSLLSANKTKNVAMKASGPQYSALCTQSVVGNDIYDVILLEYNLMADSYINILARRLRTRFPQAKIIFMRIWLPFQYHYMPSNRGLLPIIRERFGSSANPITASEILTSIVEGTQPSDWKFHEAVDKKDLLEKIALEVNGHVYHMPRPTNPIVAMTSFARYFTSDMNHFSQAGHRFLQLELVKFLHDVKAEPTSQLGLWKDKDACNLWYETGDISISHHAPHVTFLTTRHALEFPTPDNYIGIRNPFADTPVSVWINFVAGSPKGLYPTSKIQLSQSLPVEVKPHLTGEAVMHVMKHWEIGILRPAEVANLTVEMQDYNSSNYFRIVGVAYTTVQADEAQPEKN